MIMMKLWISQQKILTLLRHQLHLGIAQLMNVAILTKIHYIVINAEILINILLLIIYRVNHHDKYMCLPD